MFKICVNYFRSSRMNKINFVRLFSSTICRRNHIEKIFTSALSVSEGKRNLTRFYPTFSMRFFLSMTYSEKLRNPKWQKKRLQILERDGFKCCKCGDEETELQVHHKKYTYGKEPWEYEDHNFETLCKHCHEIVEFYKKDCIILEIRRFSNPGCNEILVFISLKMIETGKFLISFMHKDIGSKDYRYCQFFNDPVLQAIAAMVKNFNSYK